MRSHLKVYFSFEEDAQALNDSEKARLLLAMLRYAVDGSESNLTGNERFLFPVFKTEILKTTTPRFPTVPRVEDQKAKITKKNRMKPKIT